MIEDNEMQVGEGGVEQALVEVRLKGCSGWAGRRGDATWSRGRSEWWRFADGDVARGRVGRRSRGSPTPRSTASRRRSGHDSARRVVGSRTTDAGTNRRYPISCRNAVEDGRRGLRRRPGSRERRPAIVACIRIRVGLQLLLERCATLPDGRRARQRRVQREKRFQLRGDGGRRARFVA